MDNITKYFLYTSITSGQKTDIMEKNLKNTLAYKKIEKSFKENFGFLKMKSERNYSRNSFNLNKKNPYGTLFVDILTNPDAKHPKLDNIIKIAPRGLVIVIQNMRVLGNVEQIKNYYNIFREKEIYILCLDCTRLSGISEYSTSNFGFEQRTPIEEYYRAYELINEFSKETKLVDNRGKIPKFTPAFIESYWQYEMYKIPEDIAIATSGLIRSPFHRKCALYEYSKDFYIKMYYLNKEKKLALEQLPKRFSKLPEKFKELEQIVDSNWDSSLTYSDSTNTKDIEKIIDDACIELRIPSIHPINYRRIKLRQAVGRKGIAAAYNYDEDVIRKFEEYSSNPKNKLNKFWEKYKNKEL